VAHRFNEIRIIMQDQECAFFCKSSRLRIYAARRCKA
jgi:hypothetical protein